MVEKGEYFTEPPGWLDGFSLELVVELDDLVRRIGVADLEGSVRRVSVDPPERLFVTSITRSDYRGVMIGTRVSGVIANTLDDLYLTQFDDGNSYLMWERGVTVGQVRRLVGRLRSVADELDEVGATGQTVGGDAAPLRYPVDEVFSRRGLVKLPVGPVAPEDIVRAFDRPDDLAVVEILLGRGICLRRDVWYVRLRERIVKRVLQRMAAVGKLDPLKPSRKMLDRVYAAADAEIDKKYPE